MKKLAVILAMSLTGMFAHANTDVQSVDMDTMNNEIGAEGLGWVCGLNFTGTAKGFKVIIGQFKTVGYGTLHCKGIKKTYTQKVKITMGHHWLGPTVGLGYFKLAGTSGEISLLNCSPEAILGKYLVANGQAAIIGGVGAFTAVKVGMPQLAVDISLQLLKGIGAQVGIDKLSITAIEDAVEAPAPY